MPKRRPPRRAKRKTARSGPPGPRRRRAQRSEPKLSARAPLGEPVPELPEFPEEEADELPAREPVLEERLEPEPEEPEE